jgi:hypothetical protein
MSRGKTSLQPAERFVYSRSSGCGVRRSVRHPSAAHFLEDARGMQCEIWSESGRDQKPRLSGRFLLLGFDQSVSAAARFKTHGRLSAPSANASCHRRIVSSSNKSTVATSAFVPGALLGEDRLFCRIATSPRIACTRAPRRRRLARVFDRRREGYHGCLRKRGPNRRRADTRWRA